MSPVLWYGDTVYGTLVLTSNNKQHILCYRLSIISLQCYHNITLVLYKKKNTCISLTNTRAESGMVCFHYHYSCDISIVQELSVLDYTSVFIMEILLKHI